TDFIEGVGYYGWDRGDYLLPDTAWVMENQIKPLGANWISIGANVFQENITSTQIRLDYDWGMNDEDVIYLIGLAKENGLRVFLKPWVGIRYGADDASLAGRAMDFGSDEEKWTEWFDSYTEFILHYAQMAEEYQVDMFSIGAELYTGPQSGQVIGPIRRTQNFETLIAKVREIYSGPLTYSAHWKGELKYIQFWDKLDYIGIDAYYNLTTYPHATVEQLVNSWEGPIADIEKLSEKWNKPIIFTEIGYTSTESTTMYPGWPDGFPNDPVDLQIQANAYEAAFQALQDQPWWHGVFWSNWKSVFGYGGPNNRDFVPSGKPAEDVLRHYYGGTPRSITPTPVIEPVQVLFDEAHNERNTLSRENAEKLNPTYPDAAYFGELERSLNDVFLFTSNFDAPLTRELLQDYDVLFLSAPRSFFRESEINAIHTFIENGGGLIVLGACGYEYPLNLIISHYGITFESPCLFKDSEVDYYNSDKEFNNGFFTISNFEDHPVTKFPRFFMGWSGQSLKVTSPAVPLAYTDERVWADSYPYDEHDEDDLMGPFTVIAASEAGTGRIVAFSSNNYGDIGFDFRSTHYMMRSALEWVMHFE
ncbi:MAG: hypothetical protein MUO76_03760, partial [Anaerolineaceae bacterium]|nr:hypothetical protein [Anaerolineaceae bacterium]